ncbi:MAG TPA: type I DNA topoisomerase [Fimbriimonadaceae bacterium]|nr:type I DNA topoisomerase [Fimbriimonadaceae bacterium]
MAKTLVIVESPAKAQTIKRFLGSGYDLKASFGHVRDLPEGGDEVPERIKKEKWANLGVDVDNGFEPVYVVPKSKKKYVDELKKSAKGASTILLATDEDREGESISWHVLQVIKPGKDVEVKRIVFHEITPEAINEALANPREIDGELVRAQETRRILDRLYGYTLSPLLWKRVAPKLSAGRVQSVATRLVVIRERERRDFVVVEYSGMSATLATQEGEFEARLKSIGGTDIADGQSFSSQGRLTKKHRWLKSEEAGTLTEGLRGESPWTVSNIEKKPGREHPHPPFMTSTLQQEANRKLGYTARRTMQIAQQLYEGVDISGERTGLITYMRTDSLTLANRAINEARDVIASLYGNEFLPAKPNTYKSKSKNAQEAHEAIRPTHIDRKPADIKSSLTDEQFKLYELIWKRTVACQMKPAEVERTRVEATVRHDGSDFVFAASGKRISFPGFLRAYVEGADDPEADLEDKERILPEMHHGQTLSLRDITATEHATKPPARYTEASLVKELESNGVGRPSTYASIIGTIQDRGYVFKKGKELVPTFTAFAVTNLLEQNFDELVDTGYTAKMEEDLDEISNGDVDSVEYLNEFYHGTEQHPGLEPQVKTKGADIPYPQIPIGDGVVVRIGRNGPFLQRGEGGPGNTASVPDGLPPSELTHEMAVELLEAKKSGGTEIGVDPSSGRKVIHKTGRFGDYLEVEQTDAEKESGEKPKRVTLPKDVSPTAIDGQTLATLMSYPREVGTHPESGEAITLALGKFGPYLSCGTKKANIGDWRKGPSVTLEDAVAALASGGNRRTGPEEIKNFGKVEGFEKEIRLLSGRYGPYVTDGKTNATLPKGLDPHTVTIEKAVELIKERAAKGPAKKRRFTRKK